MIVSLAPQLCFKICLIYILSWGFNIWIQKQDKPLSQFWETQKYYLHYSGILSHTCKHLVQVSHQCWLSVFCFLHLSHAVVCQIKKTVSEGAFFHGTVTQASLILGRTLKMQTHWSEDDLLRVLSGEVNIPPSVLLQYSFQPPVAAVSALQLSVLRVRNKSGAIFELAFVVLTRFIK